GAGGPSPGTRRTGWASGTATVRRLGRRGAGSAWPVNILPAHERSPSTPDAATHRRLRGAGLPASAGRRADGTLAARRSGAAHGRAPGAGAAAAAGARRLVGLPGWRLRAAAAGLSEG